MGREARLATDEHSPTLGFGAMRYAIDQAHWAGNEAGDALNTRAQSELSKLMLR
jgi:hypothetical protein